MDRAYVAEYFTKHAEDWIAESYPADAGSRYPLGEERVRSALDALRATQLRANAAVLDIGCGGGQLCIEIARQGFRAIGIDLAPGMVAECQRAIRDEPADVQRRLRFRVGEAVHTEFKPAEFHAITALGLIEYLPDDGQFFAEARRILKPHGVVVVTCRNRLFNIGSANSYTQRELSAPDASLLVAELRGQTKPGVAPEQMQAFVRTLREALPALEAAVKRDLEQGGRTPPKCRFERTLRQHTPLNLAANADEHGFDLLDVVSIHPHPFPPIVEYTSPHTFNTLAQVWATLADSSASLGWSSCFQATLRKRD